MSGIIIGYSESFKLQVVRELERGRFSSREEARRFYGINGSMTISNWVRKYGKEEFQRKVFRVETVNERKQVNALKARIAELERAVVDSRVQESLHKAYFDIVCREHGVKDPETLKKNIARKLSAEHSNTVRRRKG